jgi:hypothetical protein
VLREAVKALAWRLGYARYEEYVDSWLSGRDDLA